MKTLRIVVALVVSIVLNQSARAQQPIPIRTLTPPSETSTVAVVRISGLRELPGGRVLINDGARHQLLAFDASLTTRSVVLDSTPGQTNSYPRAGARLLRHADFERVYKQGKRHFATHMTVFYLRRVEGAGPASGIRIGFTVGRALGGAVDRNRMKRRLREAVRLHESVPNVAVDVVINPKKSLRTTEFANLQNEVRRAFEVIEKQART